MMSAEGACNSGGSSPRACSGGGSAPASPSPPPSPRESDPVVSLFLSVTGLVEPNAEQLRFLSSLDFSSFATEVLLWARKRKLLTDIESFDDSFVASSFSAMLALALNVPKTVVRLSEREWSKCNWKDAWPRLLGLVKARSEKLEATLVPSSIWIAEGVFHMPPTNAVIFRTTITFAENVSAFEPPGFAVIRSEFQKTFKESGSSTSFTVSKVNAKLMASWSAFDATFSNHTLFLDLDDFLCRDFNNNGLVRGELSWASGKAVCSDVKFSKLK